LELTNSFVAAIEPSCAGNHFVVGSIGVGGGAAGAGFELRENVLDFAGMGAVGEGFGDLRVGDGAAEPGGVPEQERHDYEGEREDYDA